MSARYGCMVDLFTGEIRHEPIKEILDEDDENYWIKLATYIGGSQLDYKLKFHYLCRDNPALQRTPINLKFLVHTMTLGLTERLTMITRLLYEQGRITLEQHRTIVMDMVIGDQGMGKDVGKLTRTRLGGQHIVPNVPTADGFIPSDVVDAEGRIVGVHLSTLPLSHPFRHFREAISQFRILRVPFPEFGDRFCYVGANQRFVCVKHGKGVCKSCNIDFTGCRLIDDIPEHMVLMVMQMKAADGSHYPVFRRDNEDLPVETSERDLEYPTSMVTSLTLKLAYDENDPLTEPLCTWGNTIRYVPQWDPTVVGKDEANNNKLTSGGKTPDALLPISDLASHYCAAKDCQVTWQVAKTDADDPLAAHPSHHTAVDRIKGARRAIIVHVNGFFVQATGATPAQVGVGVFFGNNSIHNTSKRFERRQLSHDVFTDDARNREHPGVALNQTTPVYAAVVTALQRLRLRFLPTREALVAEHSRFNSGHAARDALRFRVIMVTKSRELIDSLAAIQDSYTIGFLTGQAFLRAKEAAKAKARARKKRSGKSKGNGQAESSEATGSAPTSTSPPAVEGHVDWVNFTPVEGDEKLVVFSKQTGGVIANSDGIIAVMRETALLNILGVAVEYYLQPAKANSGEGLAKNAVATK